MSKWPVHARITGPVVMIGFGSIGKGTLPLIERHFSYDKNRFVVIDPEDKDRAMLDKRGETQRMASTGLEDQDAWGIHREGGRAFLVVAFVREGLVRGRREFALPDVGDVPDESLLGDALRLLRDHARPPMQ